MKEIGILEIKYHLVYLYNISRICKTKNTRVTVFTTKDIFLELKNLLRSKNLLRNISQYNFVLKRNEESHLSFLRRVEQICDKKIDLLFINTIQGSCLDLLYFLSFRPKSKNVLTIHNVNYWFKPKLLHDIKDLKRTINISACSVIQRFLLSRYDAINVIYPPMKKYILENTNYKKEIYTLPYSFYEEIPLSEKTRKNIRFVIPGAINKGRGDYELVIKVFRELFPKYPDLEVYLLGYPKDSYGYEIIRQCKELKKQDYPIYYFDELVTRDVWQNVFVQSDVAILPFEREVYEFYGHRELWGTTKGSGSMFECIQYAKPFIIPEDFDLIKELETSTLKYKNTKDLKETVEYLINNREKINYLKKEAMNNSKKFSLKNLREYFKKEILKENKQ